MLCIEKCILSHFEDDKLVCRWVITQPLVETLGYLSHKFTSPVRKHGGRGLSVAW